MSTQPKPSLLFTRLPRQLVDRLQSASPEELQFILGGKERITTGSISVGDARYDVRYSSERASAPPLLYQGAEPQTAASGDWAQWTQRGKLVGKLTLVSKARGAATVPAIAKQAQTDASALAATLHPLSDGRRLKGSDEVETSTTAPKATPHKMPGILRQNREMLRERLLHMLALAPVDESTVLERFNGPKNVVLDMLETLGKRADDGKWALQSERFKDVEVDAWPSYNAADRERAINNAIHAFDSLGLPADDPSRVSVLQQRKRLRDGADSGASANTSTDASAESFVPAANVPRVPKDPTVPSISLPRETPTPKKKPVRSVIAPTLVRKVHMEANKAAKRIGMPGLHTTSTSNASESNVVLPPAQQQSHHGLANTKAQLQRAEKRSGRPAPLHGAKDGGGVRIDNDSEPPTAQNTNSEKEPVQNAAKSDATTMRRQMASAPNSIPNTADTSAFAPKAVTTNPRINLIASRSTNDIHSNSQQRSDTEHRNASGSRSRSSRRRRQNAPISQALSDVDTAERDQELRHVRIKSRPLHLDPTAVAALRKSPSLSRHAETGAAVSRVQERLAQEMAASSGRRLPGLNIVGNARSPKDTGTSEAKRRMAQRPRGPSLSPIADPPKSRSPPPEPSFGRPETIEDLIQLQKLLVAMYSEYSQLRLKIDSHCAEFASVADELAAAQTSYDNARREAAKREEGEEILSDSAVSSLTTLGLAVAPASNKCTPDGARLYWADGGNSDDDAWMADSPDAVAGQASDKDGQACRMRRLLPEEARMLRASKAVVDRYAELDGDDAQRWVRRYVRLHGQIEQTRQELSSSYARISSELESQLDGFRDELGDSSVDGVLSECGADNSTGPTLTIDMYRDDYDDSAGAAAAPVASHL
ncbi:hypothetical protein LPJ59_001803 [Coemansia sp. RSA 2399]|nr:hypothetical protein LPJ59_001803 [Coemansia sp. RSA 2399]